MFNKLLGNTEILQIADAVAREKSINRDAILEALEEAVRIAARRKYGHENPVKVNIDRKTGEINLFREMLVVDSGQDTQPEAQESEEEEISKVDISEALIRHPNAKVGEVIKEPLPPLDLGRLAAQSAKQVIINKVREIERQKQYEEFKDRIGEILNCVVDKFEYGNVIVKIGNAEGIIKRDQLLRSDRLKQGDRIRAYLVELDPENRGPQIILSRTHNDFLAKLFKQEVPEIYDGIIEVKKVVRDPGSRAKVAVYTSDSSIDPIGSCVGMRGSRVQSVISELKGEKIDIIEWTEDPVKFLINSLSPTAVLKVVIDETEHKIEAVIPDENLSAVIGRRGQNIRLISELVGWKIDVLTEESETKRRNQEFSAITNKFMEALDLEEILAQLLASEGYNSIQQLADASISDLASVQGLDENIAEELIARAIEYAQSHEDAAQAIKPEGEFEGKLDPDLLNLLEARRELAILLNQKGVKTISDLADLSTDEFIEIVGTDVLPREEIDSIIMQARRLEK